MAPMVPYENAIITMETAGEKVNNNRSTMTMRLLAHIRSNLKNRVLLSAQSVCTSRRVLLLSANMETKSAAQTYAQKYQVRSVTTSNKRIVKYTDEELRTVLQEIERDFGLVSEKAVAEQVEQLPPSDEWLTVGQSDESAPEYDELKGFSRQRGQTGVFDIDELVQLLRQENVKDICVISIPPQIQYVDYMVITTGKSPRQLTAVAEFVRKVYKCRVTQNEFIPNIEGQKTSDWVAMDLGNIALHIFTPKTRQQYDLETLWAVGPQHEDTEPDTATAAQILAQFTTAVTYGQQHKAAT